MTTYEEELINYILKLTIKFIKALSLAVIAAIVIIIILNIIETYIALRSSYQREKIRKLLVEPDRQTIAVAFHDVDIYGHPPDIDVYRRIRRTMTCTRRRRKVRGCGAAGRILVI